MKVGIVHYAEPVSRDYGFVLTRYAAVAKQLISDGHKVTRYFPSFDHRSRKIREFTSYNDNYGKHVLIQTSEYENSRGFGRLKFLSSFKNNVLNCDELENDVFIVGCPMPGIASALRLKYPRAIIITDVRDFWPDVQVSTAKGIRKYIFSFLGKGFRINTIRDINSSDYTVTLSQSYATRIKEACNIDYEPLVVPLGSAPIDNSLNNVSLEERCGVIFVGSISKLFDFNRLLNIWKIVCNKSYDLAKKNPLTIVGHGSEFDEVKSKADELNFINLCGFIPQREAISLMCSSKLAIAIYKSMDFHTLPNKLFEYSAAKLPVVSNWSGDVKEATKPYDFTFGDTNSSDEEIAEFMISLLSSKEKLSKASKGAENFSFDYSRMELASNFKFLISSLNRTNSDLI